LIISLWLQRTKVEVHKLLFNTAAPALSIWIAAQLFFYLTGATPLNQSATSVTSLLPGLLVFALVYFLLNSWLMATAVSFEEPLTPLQVWRQNFLWLSLTFFSGASVSILLVSISREINFSALAVIVPLLIISYLTYHTSMGRVKDAHRHVDNLNHLYLSTIETLAMAIDAKDQVTHGHIRRVQDRSVRLARSLGVIDESLIQAVTAASLLHDMGKLAIPEHILNKPGKLTVAEFEVMKTHSSLGADILAAIEFPYPVVPIVRHHHENWNGSGYPDGLSGTDIPIGARILSVVDCYDALTSDRPYRPKLTTAEAKEILLERRGSMYDPLVVDAFLSMTGDSADSDSPMSSDACPDWPAPSLPSSVPLLWGDDLISCDSLNDRALPYNVEVLANYLTRQPGSLLIFYAPDTTRSCLVVARAWGARDRVTDGLKIPMGKRLSGWVAVAGRPVFNAGPSLDFVDYGGMDVRSIRSSGAVPITINSKLVGVLTIYSRSTTYPTATTVTDLALTSEHLSCYLASLSALSNETHGLEKDALLHEQ
jgi:putative nucleotidyltransferase with HDIG domain